MKTNIPVHGIFRHAEAYKRSQLAKLHGLPDDHCLIKPYDPAYLPKVNAAIIAAIYAGTGEYSGVAPAAGVSPVPAEPRLGNTGITSIRVLRDYLDYIERYDWNTHDKIKAIASKGQGVVIIDWLSCTFPRCTDENEQRQLIAALQDACAEVDIQFFARDKGLHGYTGSASLQVFSGAGGDFTSVGMVAWSDRQGVLFELSGQGCKALGDFGQVYDLVGRYAGRITRLDLALDLDSAYCQQKKITVPGLGVDANQGVFRSKYAPAHVSQTLNMQGDWSPFTFGGLIPDTYNPSVFCPRGLTLYVGASTSENQIVMYEKGKQLLGAIPDENVQEFKELLQSASNPAARARRSKLADKYGYDPAYEDKKHWVRVERRIRRGSNKKDINPAMLLDADSAFSSGFPGLESLLENYASWCSVANLSLSEIRSSRDDDKKELLLTRKLHWCRVAYGRLVTTLRDEGLTAGQIIDAVGRADGLKSYIFDLMDDNQSQ